MKKNRRQRTVSKKEQEMSTQERKQLYFKPEKGRIPYAGKPDNTEKMA